MYGMIAQRRHRTSAINASAAIDSRRDIDLWCALVAAQDKFRSYHKATSTIIATLRSSSYFYARYSVSREHASC